MMKERTSTIFFIQALACLAVLTLCSNSTPSAAQGRASHQRSFDIAGPVPEDVRRDEGFRAMESAGIFVGVEKFKDGRFADVSYAVDDAVDLAYVFALELALIHPSNVVLSLAGEPAKPESQNRLDDLIRAGAKRRFATQSDIYELLDTYGRKTGPQGLFVVAMATHGFTGPEGDFLLGSDSLGVMLKRTGVATTEVYDMVAKARASRRIVLLDACREGSSSVRGVDHSEENLDPSMSKYFVDALGEASGQVVLFGATRNGFAYGDPEKQNGVFASAVIEGLRGGASGNERSFITVRTLAEYVHQRVVDWVNVHRPDHAGFSRGISTILEGAAARIPLALRANDARELEEFYLKRDSALLLLHQNIRGPGNLGSPINGRMYDEVVEMLDTQAPGEGMLKFLDEITTLDGTTQMQRNVAFYFQNNKTEIQMEGTGFSSKSTGLDSSYTRPLPTIVPKPRIRIPENSTPRISDNRPPRLGDVWTDPVSGIVFAYVARGSFIMGSSRSDVGMAEIETPPHEVSLSRGFWMATTEVTIIQFANFVAETNYTTDAERHRFSYVLKDGEWRQEEYVTWRQSGHVESDRPVVHVSWNDAVAFCQWLSRRTGKQIRLPTEAEWEYSVRAGTATSTYAGNLNMRDRCDTPGLESIAWYCGSSSMVTQPVGLKKANAWGLHDLLGNASEWVRDGFGRYTDQAQTDPTGLTADDTKAIRGGSAFFDARSTRAASRSGLAPDQHYAYLGFRVLVASSR